MSKIFLDKNNRQLGEFYETTEIVANPEVEGEAEDLETLLIGKKKYNVAGGGSGSVIVDALPAEGKEGQTYLLRKAENEPFKAHCYIRLYGNGSSRFLIGDGDLHTKFKDAIYKKLDPSLGVGLVDFEQLESDISNYNVSTSEQFEQYVQQNGIAIVQTEADVLAIDHDVDMIIQDLGEVGIENFNYIEYKNSTEAPFMSMFLETPQNLCLQLFINDNNELVYKQRNILYHSELEPGQSRYEVGEWTENIEGPCVGRLTDDYEYNEHVIEALNEDDEYLINLTPEALTYSYIEYVYDRGVYTKTGEEPKDSIIEVDVNINNLKTDAVAFEKITNSMKDNIIIVRAYGPSSDYSYVPSSCGISPNLKYDFIIQNDDYDYLTFIYTNLFKTNYYSDRNELNVIKIRIPIPGEGGASVQCFDSNNSGKRIAEHNITIYRTYNGVRTTEFNFTLTEFLTDGAQPTYFGSNDFSKLGAFIDYHKYPASGYYDGYDGTAAVDSAKYIVTGVYTWSQGQYQETVYGVEVRCVRYNNGTLEVSNLDINGSYYSIEDHCVESSYM